MLKITNIREMQIKTTSITSYLLGWLLSKTQKTTNVSKDMEKLEPLYTVGDNVKWYIYCGKQYGHSSKN